MHLREPLRITFVLIALILVCAGLGGWLGGCGACCSRHWQVARCHKGAERGALSFVAWTAPMPPALWDV